MEHGTGTFKSADGLELFCQHWEPATPPRARVVLVHGVNEHSDRYANLVTPLISAGYAVHAYDQRGHGRSPGHRAHILTWDEYRDDLDAFRQRLPEAAAVFLYGHSMGSLVVLDNVLHDPEGLSGMILSGVPIDPAGVAHPALVAFARLLTNLWPKYPHELGIDVEHLSRDPEVVQAYRDDPLCTSCASVRWGTESLDRLDWVKDEAAGLALPSLILHGGTDRVNRVEGAKWLYEQIEHSDKTLHIYPGSFHEPHNDLDHPRVANDLIAWLNDRCTS